jgi:MFS family permease
MGGIEAPGPAQQTEETGHPLYSAGMRDRLERVRRLHPFQSADARRLAFLFAVVYFSQGMWYLPNQVITIVLKERGLSAGDVASFFAISTIPWLIKPAYGLVSDFVPLFGRRRKSYFLLTSLLAAISGLALGSMTEHSYWWLAALFTLMGFGLAFTDVLTDALMVESGKPLGLTGAFQAVQWAAIYGASMLVGVLGGFFAERRDLKTAFLVAGCFPVVSFVMALLFVHEAPSRPDRAAFLETWAAIRSALRDRTVWVVAGFILFFTFSPSFGPALLYFQTDRLKFSQQFIGHLTALASAGAVAGALLYAPLSRRVPLRRIVNVCIGLTVAGTLAYVLYRDPLSAVLIDTVYGFVYMLTQLCFLDLAAKACPRHVEATFFALLMSVYNGGTQGSQVVGGYLYDWMSWSSLVCISAAFTAVTWILVPLIKIDEIEARARAGQVSER